MQSPIPTAAADIFVVPCVLLILSVRMTAYGYVLHVCTKAGSGGSAASNSRKSALPELGDLSAHAPGVIIGLGQWSIHFKTLLATSFPFLPRPAKRPIFKENCFYN